MTPIGISRANADLNALLLAAKEKDVLHIGEAHELKKEYQTALYLAMDKRTLVVQSGSGSPPYNLPLADFTLLLSTTDEYCLLQPLRDRMNQLVGTTFPHPIYDVASRRPFYNDELQQVCLDVRKRNHGIDGKPLLFYSRRLSTNPRKLTKRSPSKSSNKHLVAGLTALGLDATAKQVESAIATFRTPDIPPHFLGFCGHPGSNVSGNDERFSGINHPLKASL